MPIKNDEKKGDNNSYLLGWKSIADIETWTKVSSKDISQGNVHGWNIWSWQRVFLPEQMRVFSPHYRCGPEKT